MNEKNISIRIPGLSDHSPTNRTNLLSGDMGERILEGLRHRMENTDCVSLIQNMVGVYPHSLNRPFDRAVFMPPQPRYAPQPVQAPPPQKLRAEQLAKDRCQTIAKMLWKQNPSLTIAELTRHPMIRDKELGGGQFYEPRTVYDWIAEIKNHPQKNKRGRPRKSLN
jgi:hypothetical protein